MLQSLVVFFSSRRKQTQLDRTTPRSGASAFTSGENYQLSPNQCNLRLERRRDNSEISLNSTSGLKWPPREKQREKKEQKRKIWITHFISSLQIPCTVSLMMTLLGTVNCIPYWVWNNCRYTVWCLVSRYRLNWTGLASASIITVVFTSRIWNDRNALECSKLLEKNKREQRYQQQKGGQRSIVWLRSQFFKKLNFTRDFPQKEATVLTNIAVLGKIFFFLSTCDVKDWLSISFMFSKWQKKFQLYSKLLLVCF